MIAATALLPCAVYALFGLNGHDFSVHMPAWAEVSDAWRAGLPMPEWSTRANYMLGDPRYLFYPPVAIWLGAALHWLLPAVLVPGAFVWLALTVAGLCMYRAADGLVAERDRRAAALLYMLNPYLLTTALVRFAAAELLVQAWLPLLVVWLARALWRDDRRAALLLGCGLGLSWLTNIPAAVVLAYGFGVLAIFAAWRRRSDAPLVGFVLAEGLGLALAAFRLAPAWAEKRFVSPDSLVRFDLLQTLLLMPQRHSGLMQPKLNFLAGCWLLALAGVGAVGIVLWRRTAALRGDAAAQSWVVIAGAALLFQLPLAAPLWLYGPQLRTAGFPFRFLALEWVVVPLIAFALATPAARRGRVVALTLLLGLLPLAEYVHVQTNPQTRLAPVALLEQHWRAEGYRGVPELVPAGQTWQIDPPSPRPPRSAEGLAGQPCTLQPDGQSAPARPFTVTAQGECWVHLALYAYPYWRAFDERGAMLETGVDQNGLLAVEVEPGVHTVRLAFHAQSRLRTIAGWVSLAALLLAGLCVVVFWRLPPRPGVGSVHPNNTLPV